MAAYDYVPVHFRTLSYESKGGAAAFACFACGADGERFVARFIVLEEDAEFRSQGLFEYSCSGS